MVADAAGVMLAVVTVAVTLVPVVLGVRDAGENEQPTPIGSGSTQLKVTVPGEVVEVAFTLMVNVVEEATCTVLLVGETAMVNEGVVEETVSVALALRVCPALVPVTGMVFDPV